jgi:AraC-like DNA-binding protein
VQPIPLTRRHHLQHFTDALEKNGYCSERLLSRFGVPMWQYGDANDLIPLQHVLKVVHEGSRMVGNDKFGLFVGEQNCFNSSTTMGMLISRSPTVYHAMETTCRLANAHTSLARMWLEEAGDTVWFCRSQLPGMNEGLRQHEQYVVMVLMGVVRLGAGPAWKPSEIWLCSPRQSGLGETAAFSDIAIRYGRPHGALAVPRSLVFRPLRKEFAPTTFIDESAIKSFMSTIPTGDFVGSLRQVIPSLLTAGCTHLDCAAQITGVHIRALQRILEREGVTFSQLVDEARFNQATRLLKETDATVTDIAFDLGYTDVAHFSRAFRRWSGVSPRQYRQFTMAV